MLVHSAYASYEGAPASHFSNTAPQYSTWQNVISTQKPSFKKIIITQETITIVFTNGGC